MLKPSIPHVFFRVKLTFGKLTVCGIRCAAFIFDTRTGFLWKFLRQKMSRPERDSNPPTSRFMPNALTNWAIRARHLLSHVCDYWLWRYRYIWSKVIIWNGNCARRNSIHFWHTDGCSCESVKVLRQQKYRPEVDSSPQPSDSCECSNHLSYQGQTFAVLCFLILAQALKIFWIVPMNFYILLIVYK